MRRPLLGICTTLILFHAAQGRADSAWNGGSGNWSTDSNWSPAGVPAGGPATALTFGGSASYTSVNDLGNFALNSLIFNNGAGTAILSASPATNVLDFVSSSSHPLAAIALTGAGSATLSAPVLFDGSAAITNTGSGTLLFNGAQTFASGTRETYTNSGTGTLTLADAVTYSRTGANTGLVLNLINNNPGAGTFNLGNVGGLSNVTFNIGGSGTVRFSGNTGGDLFSDSALVNVLSGAMLDLNGNGETMGAISGAGTIREAAAGITVDATGYYVFSGKVTGAAGTLGVNNAAHTLVLSGAANDYTGVTTITAGRLIISASAPSGSAGALGSATSEVLIGGTSGSLTARLLADTTGVNVGRNLRLQSGNSGTAAVGGLNTAGTVTYSGNLTLGTNSTAAKGATLFAAPGGTVEFTGNLLRATGATGSSDTVTVTGGGTVALRGTNTFTGATSVSAGTLLLDLGTNNTAKLSSTASLILSGGSLSVAGNSAGASAVTVSDLSLGAATGVLGGAGHIAVTSGTDQNATLSLGAITHNPGGTADFAPLSTGAGVAAITTATANTASILGGFATFNGNDWAANDGSGKIVSLPAATYTSSFGSGLQTSLGGNTTLPAGGGTTNSLRFNTAAALTFNATANTLALESGGLLVASTAGATSIGGTTVRGAISTPGGELMVHQQSTAGTLTINSVIGGTNLTKSGVGTLVLTGTNTYTGNTFINSGTVAVTASANLGAANSDVTLNGGTLSLLSGTLGTLSAASRTITIGPAGGTLNLAVDQALTGGLTGSGPLTKAGVGVLSVGSSATSYTGDLLIANGAVKMNSAQLNLTASITVGPAGVYNIEDDATSTFSLAAGGRFVLNGDGFGGNGSLRVTDQSPFAAGAGVDPKSTIDREVALAATSRIQVENGSAPGSVSQLTLTGNVTGSGGLVKSGTGVLVLTSRDNTYSGDTAIQAGTLRIDLGHDRLPVTTNVILGANGSSGMLQLNGFAQTVASLTTSGTGTANAVLGGATARSVLTWNVAAGAQSYSGTLGGTGVNDNDSANNLAVVKTGAGSATLGIANPFSGGVTVAQGTLALGDDRALGHAGAALSQTAGSATVLPGATLDLNGQTKVQEAITLSGAGAAGAGALVNNGATAAILGSGIASLNVASFTPAGWSADAALSIAPSPTGAAAKAMPVLGLSTASLSLTSGGSNFTLGNGVVTIGGGSGAVVAPVLGVTAASYTVTPGTTTYSDPPAVTLSNGASGLAVMDSSGHVTGIGIVAPGSGFTTTPTATFSGGTVATSGTAPTAAGNNTHYTLAGLNVLNPGYGFTSVPTVTITGGTGATATGVDGNFVLNGITVTDPGSGYTTAPLVNITSSTGAATATANLSSLTLAAGTTIGGSGDLTVQAGISGAYDLTKAGAGTLRLAGANTFTGPTSVNEGTLEIYGSLSGSLQARVNGGTLRLGASDVLNDALALTLAGGTFATAGFSEGNATTGGLGLLSVTANSVLDFGTGTGSQLLFAGLGAHSGGMLSIVNWSGLAGQTGADGSDRLLFTGDAATFSTLYPQSDVSFNNVSGFTTRQYDATHFEVVAIPEPSSLALLGAGAGLAMFRRRPRAV